MVVHTCNPSTWEDHELKVSLGYRARSCLKTKTKKDVAKVAVSALCAAAPHSGYCGPRSELPPLLLHFSLAEPPGPAWHCCLLACELPLREQAGH
jgi:hypothetical protein